MRDHAAYALQSDPESNRQFRRRWSENSPQPRRACAEPIRLIEVPNALDAHGTPRAALLVPPAPDAVSRRPVIKMFASVAAAIAAKRSMEGSR
jgi:ferric-dicitrate binding protein FerR (iron transport regulator)